MTEDEMVGWHHRLMDMVLFSSDNSSSISTGTVYNMYLK